MDRKWRGIGEIPGSGLGLRPEFADFDAEIRFGLTDVRQEEPTECRAGDVLRGLLGPISARPLGPGVPRSIPWVLPWCPPKAPARPTSTSAAFARLEPWRPSHDGSRCSPVGWYCPVPGSVVDRVQLGHGSGGKMSQQLVRERFLPHLDNPVLPPRLTRRCSRLTESTIAITTDSFVVSPLEFPGGNIGSLAVHGTLNDLAMMGAAPVCLSAGFILEEGLPFELLDRVVAAMGKAAREADVPIVTADTKVVERGKADGLYINTSGLGRRMPDCSPGPNLARPGDVVILSAPIARHGMAIMAVRESLGFEAEIESDSAVLWPVVSSLLDRLGREVHSLRDPTRGGLASA